MDEFLTYLNEFDKIKCSQHGDEDILMICTHPACGNCLLCFECVTDHDPDHKSKIVQVEDFKANLTRVKQQISSFYKEKQKLPAEVGKAVLDAKKLSQEKTSPIEAEFERLKTLICEKIDKRKKEMMFLISLHKQDESNAKGTIKDPTIETEGRYWAFLNNFFELPLGDYQKALEYQSSMCTVGDHIVDEYNLLKLAANELENIKDVEKFNSIMCNILKKSAEEKKVFSNAQIDIVKNGICKGVTYGTFEKALNSHLDTLKSQLVEGNKNNNLGKKKGGKKQI